MVQHIYKIINTRNNKFYVGRSLNIRQRLNRHLNHLKRGIHDNIYLQRAWNLDSEFFECQIVISINTGDADRDLIIAKKCEQWYLDNYAIGKELYNVSPSSQTGVSYGEAHPNFGKSFEEFAGTEGVIKHRKAMDNIIKEGTLAKENNPFYGRKHTPETIELLRIKCAQYKEDNPFYGKKHTDASKEKMSQSRKGKCTGGDNPSTKRVCAYGVEYPTMSEAANSLNITMHILRKYLTDESNTDIFFI